MALYTLLEFLITHLDTEYIYVLLFYCTASSSMTGFVSFISVSLELRMGDYFVELSI